MAAVNDKASSTSSSKAAGATASGAGAAAAERAPAAASTTTATADDAHKKSLPHRSRPEDRTKVVVRGLPPGLSEADLLAAVDRVAAGTYGWRSFHAGGPGALAPGAAIWHQLQQQQRGARAYFDFNTPADVRAFKAAFDGHVFVGARGAQHSARAEYAPFQKVPRPRGGGKRAPMEGTIEKGARHMAARRGFVGVESSGSEFGISPHAR
jgi:hypothetical protein